MQWHKTLPLIVAVISTQALAFQETNIVKLEKGKERIFEQLVNPYAEYGLTEEEYDRYQKIMKTTSAQYRYKHLEPIEVLGVEALTDSERKRFAKMIAKATKEKTERILELQRAVNEAYLELYGNEPAFSMTGDEARYSTRLNVGDTQTFVLVVAPEDKEAKYLVEKLVNKVTENSKLKLDIYIKSKDSQLIMEWAEMMKIPKQLVMKKRITLNRHQDELLKITGNMQYRTPLIGSIEGDSIKLLSLNSI